MFLLRNDVPVKAVLRNTLSGEGEVQMLRLLIWGKPSGWPPFSSSLSLIDFSPGAYGQQGIVRHPRNSSPSGQWLLRILGLARGRVVRRATLLAPFPHISGVEDIRTVSSGYAEGGGVRGKREVRKNSTDFFKKKFIFSTTLNFFKKGKNSKNRKIIIYVALSQTWASFPCFSKNWDLSL